MPALSGEPWRGLSKIQVDNGLGARRSYTVSIVDVVPDTAASDTGTWEGTAGGSVTLRFEWDTVGSPAWGQADTVRVVCFIPGSGTGFGTNWNVSLGGADSGVVTRTFTFGQDPLHATTPGAARCGMVELWIEVSRAASIAWGPVTSRGVGTPPTGTTLDWGRGYIRAPVTLLSTIFSDVAAGGAEPSVFYATKTTYNRWVANCSNYRPNGIAAAMQHRQAGVNIRSSAAYDSAVVNGDGTVTIDYNWDAAVTGAANQGRINKDYAAAQTVTGVRLALTALNFGGDNEYVWATAGHAAGWTRLDELTLEDADRIAVDPRIQFDQLLQVATNVWQTPPTAGEADPPGERLNAELGFLASRAMDMTGVGLNGVAWTDKLWDVGGQVGTEVAPVKSDSVVSTTQGGEAGWSDGATIPLAWDSPLPGGEWTHKQVLTSADLVGLEVGNTRTLVLLTLDPRISLHMEAGDTATPAEHWFPGKPLTVGLGIIKSMVLLTPDAGFARLALLRFDPTIGNMRYLDPTDPALNTWTPIPSSGIIGYFDYNTTPAVAASPGNAKLILLSLTGPQTGQSNWNTFDILVSGILKFNGVEYPDEMRLIATGSKWKHGSNEPEASITFDPVAGHHHVGTDSRAIGER